MNRDSIFIILSLALLVIALRWYVYDTDSFLVAETPYATGTAVPTPQPTATPIPVVSPLRTPTPRGSPVATKTPKPTSTPSSQRVVLDVPFASQAPFGDWSDPRQQDACEETSVIMALHWALGTPLSLEKALEEIHALSAFAEKQFGTYHDSSIGDTNVFFTEFYDYDKTSVQYDITLDDIKSALSAGKIVIVPVDGRLLNNPHFTPPGPIHHMLVIKGFDDAGQYFITNEPGTRYGESYRYSYSIMQKAIRDYPTGKYEPLTSVRKAMIVVSK